MKKQVDPNLKKDPKANWWMEMDPKFDLENLETLAETKELLKDCDPGDLPLSEDFFDGLHDKIMTAIEKTHIHVERPPLWRRYRSLVTRGVATGAIVLVICMGIKTQKAEEDSWKSTTDQILTTAMQGTSDPSLLSYQNQDDFFVDVALENLNHLTIDQLNDLMGSNKASD